MLVSWHALGGRPRQPTRARPSSSSARSTASTTCTSRATSRSSRSSRSTSATPGCSRAPVVDELRERARGAAAGDEQRRCRYLLELAVGGSRAGEPRREEADAGRARGRAGDRGRRRAPALPPGAVAQANEPDPERRARSRRPGSTCSSASSTRSTSRSLERSHALARELGLGQLPGDVRGAEALDLGALERQTRAFLGRDRPARYRELRRAAAARAGRLRLRSAAALRPAVLLPRHGIRRAVSRGAADRGARARRSRGLGIDLHAQPNVHLDLEPRPHKSPRAFCAPVRVPGEVYLVIPRQRRARRLRGAVPRGRPHRALRQRRCVAAVRVPPPRRQLGHRGLRVPVRAPDRGPGVAASASWAPRTSTARYLDFTRASKFVFLRRYAAKLSTSWSCTAASGRWTRCPRSTPACSAMRSASSGRQPPTWPTSTRATTPRTTCARGRSRRTCAACCVERFGRSGSARREAGDLLRELWREGQRLDADELLAQVTGERLDFAVMLDEV